MEEQLRAREANAQLLDAGECPNHTLASPLAESLSGFADEVCDKSSAHWELFYERNASKFFRDRHYLQRDYPEIFAALPDDARILECGCGAGNTVWPLLECFPKWTALAFDCSPTAVQLVAERRHPRVEHCFVWDPCAQPVPRDVLADGSVDLAIMMFFLSALPSEDGIRSILRSCAAMLKPNGLLLVRDYGVFDMTQLRFAGKKGRKVADNVYCRADGTLSRFFDAQWLGETAAACGLRPVKVGYECRELRNRKRMIMMYRCWVSCVFARPDEPSHHE